VTDENAAQAAVQTAVAAFGRLDVVVNNAGYGDIAPFEQLSAERFKAVMDTDFYGVVNVTRAAVPLMREQRELAAAVNLLQRLADFLIDTCVPLMEGHHGTHSAWT
jgi:NAD(P)-dependent dehydrogenase (short-subunit alcohol dehydrogenase family)